MITWGVLIIVYVIVAAAGWILGWGLAVRHYSHLLAQANRAIDTLVRPYAGLELSDDERRYLALQARYASRRAREWHHTPDRAERWDMIAKRLDPESSEDGVTEST